MIRGLIHRNQPLIRIRVESRLGFEELIALVDSGFTGELKLSPEHMKTLGLRKTHTETLEFANEEKKDVDAGLAVVALEGAKEAVTVLFFQGMPIIGVGLIKKFGYNLDLDFQYDTLAMKRWA